MFNVLLIGSEIRHEIACAAALKYYGLNVIYVHVNGDWFPNKNEMFNVKIGEKIISVPIYNIKVNSFVNSYLIENKLIVDLCEKFLPEIILATPGFPWYIGKAISQKNKIPLIIRFWGTKIAKIFDSYKYANNRNLEFLNFFPSLLHTTFQANASNYVVNLDYLTNKWVNRVTFRKTSLIYPSYASIITKLEYDYLTDDVIEKLPDKFLLAFTPLDKTGIQHVLGSDLLIRLSFNVANEENDVNVVLVGPSLNELVNRYGNKLKNKKNLFCIPFFGLNDERLEMIYKKSNLVLIPIFLSSVSNRFLEAMNYGCPIMTNSTVIKLYPELKEELNIVFNDNYLKYPSIIAKIIRDEEYVNILKRNTNNINNKLFSPFSNGMKQKIIIEKCLL
jgi:hypothetical protein